jgi:hypothetical protein
MTELKFMNPILYWMYMYVRAWHGAGFQSINLTKYAFSLIVRHIAAEAGRIIFILILQQHS